MVVDKVLLDPLTAQAKASPPTPDEHGPAEFPFRRLPADAQCPGTGDGDAYSSAPFLFRDSSHITRKDLLALL